MNKILKPLVLRSTRNWVNT